ncbi:MAG: acyl-CoA thioesterase [Bdellovibrionaceae bacterium]|nr:acyl-CoA thioesterase [Bdellovibrionales bacterium]MCB9084936.1 acyl-CoA thioesterase [Pseudobdellovibrionaceae bacterium]
MKFSRQLTCHFDQCDPAGIMFYGHVFTISHQTIECFLQHIGIGWEEWFRHPTYAVPVRHSEADFTVPIRAGEKFKAVLEITKMGKTSLSFTVTLQNEQGQACAVIKSAHVFVNKSDGQKASLPSEFSERLQRYLT